MQNTKRIIQTQERLVQVPQVVAQEVVRNVDVPQTAVQEKIVEVPQIQTVEKIVLGRKRKAHLYPQSFEFVDLRSV